MTKSVSLKGRDRVKLLAFREIGIRWRDHIGGRYLGPPPPWSDIYCRNCATVDTTLPAWKKLVYRDKVIAYAHAISWLLLNEPTDEKVELGLWMEIGRGVLKLLSGENKPKCSEYLTHIRRCRALLKETPGKVVVTATIQVRISVPADFDWDEGGVVRISQKGSDEVVGKIESVGDFDYT